MPADGVRQLGHHYDLQWFPAMDMKEMVVQKTAEDRRNVLDHYVIVLRRANAVYRIPILHTFQGLWLDVGVVVDFVIEAREGEGLTTLGSVGRVVSGDGWCSPSAYEEDGRHMIEVRQLIRRKKISEVITCRERRRQ
ncbi:hypothetical protein GW17_00049561 [Ensete ventricosum]|nr:hypothetical protein GW17_00049561 [Ensete ventricosum]